MSKELATVTEKAPQRALYGAMGISGDDLARPCIAVLTAASEASPEFAALHALTESVKCGVLAAGGTPFVLPVLGLAEGLAAGHEGMSYALPSREWIADGVESVLSAHAYDGAVLVSAGDQTAPGMLMGAVRANLPTVLVSGGHGESGAYRGKAVAFNDVCAAAGAVKVGKASRGDLESMEKVACMSCGSYGTYADNAFPALTEALGIALPYNATAKAGSAARLQLGRRAGAAVMQLAESDTRPRRILGKAAFSNALRLDAALGGSTDAVLHLMALAAECNVTIDLNTIQKIYDTTPTLCSADTVRDMEALSEAGGVPAVLRQLARLSLIDGDVTTVTGAPLRQAYDGAEVLGNAVRTAENPLSPTGGLAILRGNLCEEGALVRRSTLSPKLRKPFVGKAKVYDSERDCLLALSAGKIEKGDVLIVRYEGPKGGPGMRSLTTLVATLHGMGLDEDVALITDGRLHGDTHGIAVGHACPEAAVGGKLALVHNGDKITVDVDGGKLNLDLPAKEMTKRTKQYRPHDDDPVGSLLRYKYLVTSAAQGAVLKKKF